MFRISCRFFPLAGLLLACSPLALRAGVLTVTVGSAVPSFTDGQTGIGTATFNTAVAGNPAPFNGIIGSDVSGPNFSGSWVYSYAAIVDTISSATLTLGIFDHDSAASGNQVASFTLDGTDLTTLLNAAFEGHGGTGGEYDIYSITLPAATFASLASGAPGLALSLQAPGLGVLGTTPFNGAGLDFSTLSITTGTVNPIPEPGTWLMLGAGLAALILGRPLRRA